MVGSWAVIVVIALLTVATASALAIGNLTGVVGGDSMSWHVVLTAVLCLGLGTMFGLVVARRRSADAALDRREPAPSSPVPVPTPVEPRPWEALLRFAHELNTTAEMDRIQAVIARTLPEVLGTRDVWVVTRFGTRQRIIVPEGTRTPMLNSPREWMTFPLVVESATVGVLGIGLGRTRLSDAKQRVAGEVASLVAHALRTSDAFERMREESTIDGITGCLTRPAGIARLEVELNRTQRTGRPLALLLLDLDHFKTINDRFGHPCGDAVLAAIGRIIMQSLRAIDVRCRWGGEEFLIALPDTSLQPATTVAESLRRRISEARIEYEGVAVQTTASVGITLAGPGDIDRHNLLVRADAALYRAKHDGRNCVRAVVGPLRTATTAAPQAAPAPPDPLRFPERRDPSRPDRRKTPGPGRRRTDSQGGHPRSPADLQFR